MPADQSLKPDPKRKGSYYRRIEDIYRALKVLDADKLPTVAQFVTYFFGCEKLAHGIVGIHSRSPANTAYRHGTHLKLCKIKSAARALNLSIADNYLDYLFADYTEQGVLRGYDPQHTKSARVLRNTLVHDFGPSNANKVSLHAKFLVPKMTVFLDGSKEVLAYLKQHFGGVP